MEVKDEQSQAWQEGVFNSIRGMVQAADGDFGWIAQLSQAVNEPRSLQLMVDFLSQTPTGKQAFQERPRLGEVDLVTLSHLTTDSFGYAYAQHMLTNGLKPILADEAENEGQFLNAHITETHDIWHVITGSDTSILGEIQLEAFYVAQLYASRFWLALLAKNLLKATVYDIEVSTAYMDAIAKGWTMAKQAKPLFGMAWNQHWQTPLSVLRCSLNVIPA